jgi:hypothetical protein
MSTTDPFAAVETFYAAVIRSSRLGPRRELTLIVETFPRSAHSFKDGKMIEIRFGAISNYEEIYQFFSTVPSESLHHLRAESRSGSDCVVDLEFDRSGKHIQIIASHIVVQA